jgi:DNA mismatch repair protein MutL
MVLMDPQAAHERVIFERYIAEASRGAIHSQGLLPAETVGLLPEQARSIRKFIPALQEMGIGIGEFGGDTFVVDTIPAVLGHRISATQLLSDLAVHLEKGSPRIASPSWVRDQVAQAACHAAVRANDQLKPGEIDALVRDLARCEMPYTCPHGRPTVIFMGFNELRKKFGRT